MVSFLALKLGFPHFALFKSMFTIVTVQKEFLEEKKLTYVIYAKMESKNCKRLKRDDDDGVRAGGEGNITACLNVPLLEEHIPGT